LIAVIIGDIVDSGKAWYSEVSVNH